MTQDGYVVTCTHVVRDASELFVRFQKDSGEREVVQANVVIQDEAADLAIIKMESGSYLCAQIDDSNSRPSIGTDIAILGFPFGGRMNDDVMELELSFTRGYVSSNQVIKGQKRTLLDISAKAGNSGSPVISCENGQVVGILAGSYTGGGLAV